jgi:replicative DNA helicase
MEMPAEEITYRMICAATGLNTRAQNNMENEDWTKLTAGFSILKDKNLIIDDGSGRDIHHLKTSIRNHNAKHGQGFYVIDYLQLMTIKGENRIQGIGQVTRELKNLARELDVPILLLSQLSRGLEQRPDKRPLMSDLRESGEIEQDADVIVFIYRDEVYNENSEQKGITELIVRKYRQGETGTVRVSTQLQHARFVNLSYTH